MKEKTKLLYGIEHEELQKLIANEMLKTHYDVRIKVLKRNLSIELEKSTTNPMVDKILDAIEFWEGMKDGI